MKRKNLVIHNTSRYPDRWVRRLVAFAYEEVKKVAHREGWLHLLQRQTYLHVGNSAYSYKGRYCNQRKAYRVGRGKIWKKAGIPESSSMVVIHCNVGSPDRFPSKVRDDRFKDMPDDYSLANWQEAVVMLTAHELGHHHYRGNKHGEYNCDLLGEDAVRFFRKKLAPEIMDEELPGFKPKREPVKRKTLEERIAEKLNGIDYTLEGNHGDWWLYHDGYFNSAMGEGCHLIHESTLQAVWRIVKDGLTKCKCGDTDLCL